MDWIELTNLIKNNKGKTAGIVIGFFFGILTVTIGFWKTFFITVCILIGYYIGKRLDDDERLQKMLDKFINNR